MAQEIAQNAQEKAKALEKRARSQAEMDRRKSLLAAKQELVGAAFDQALRTLAELSEEERALLMVRMAVKYQTGDAELIFNQKDQQSVGPAVVSTVNAVRTREKLKETFSGSFLEQVKKLVFDQPAKYQTTLSAQVGGFSGGFIIKQGNIEHNCTFAVLVNAVREELEGDVAALLFQ